MIKKEEWMLKLVTELDQLLAMLDLPNDLLQEVNIPMHQFPLRVPVEFVKRMQKGDPNDPLLKQVLPVKYENESVINFTKDPLGESGANKIPGLLHKYHGRVLVTLAGSCVVNCRYCFRRHFPYEDNQITKDRWREILNYIKKDASIKEVIFSGGDPLLVKDGKLKSLVHDLENISHLTTLRIHSRIPIMTPSRITDEFVEMLSGLRLQSVIVTHCNHAQEIDSSVVRAISKLKNSGVTVLNQAVLLKGVNDSVKVLKDLSEAIFAAGAIPYYLHALDKVQGAAHFDVSIEEGRRLIAELEGLVPGYLVPTLVCEEAGAKSKVRL